ncbi:MAG: monovalent cation/H(+) antiporter subunit G [Candidatus Methanospirare jalkutatii]|nr:MAG: monovalent cation/H(+) antiporter subunit G [Candidatus Methanospirare jalkutatii]UYZ40218.1 MAG: monovalent cation/H(+) antiporter subunit G [Candidatus Methanospirare jalkutatii]
MFALIEAVVDVLTTAFLIFGAFFMVTGAIGLLRFPDFYTRLHATGKCDTLGEVAILFGCMIYSAYHGMPFVVFKLLCIIIFFFIANPTGTHAIMKAAYKTGVKPWRVGEERR